MSPGRERSGSQGTNCLFCKKDQYWGPDGCLPPHNMDNGLPCPGSGLPSYETARKRYAP